MLKYYLKVISRNFRRNKLFAILNTIGLSMGFASVILIVIFVEYETNFESFHTNAERIYRATYHYNAGNDFNVHWARVPVDYINELPEEIPEIEKLIRFQNHERKYVHINEDKFEAKHAYITDKEVFEVFSFELKQGNPVTALAEPYSVVITESLSKKYFNNESALGKEIYIVGDWSTEEQPFVITGIMADLPSNTHLPVEMLFSFAKPEERSGWAYVYTFLQNGASISQLNVKVHDFIQAHAKVEDIENVKLEFQPLPEIHLNSNLAREIIPNGNGLYILIFTSVGILILLVAILNFINLSLAIAMERSKEMGMHKILGAGNVQLINYMVVESILYNLFALLIGSLIAYLGFPYFKSLTGIFFTINSFMLSGGMILLVLFSGAMAGFFPAYRFAGMHPRDVINNKVKGSFHGKGIFSTKRVLIVIQFGVSIVLIGSALIARDQFLFLNEKNLGISKEQILVIPGVPNKVTEDYNTFKSQVESLKGISKVASCMEVPSREIRDSGPVFVQGVNEKNEEAPVMDVQIIDNDYIEILDIELIEGTNIPLSFFSRTLPEFNDAYKFEDYLAETSRAYLINETGMKALGWHDPKNAIGQNVSWQISSYKLAMGPIVGVVRDYHQETLKNKIDPTIFFYEPVWLRTFLIKTDTEDLQGTISGIQSVWDKLFPQFPFEFHFLDDMYEQLYKDEAVKLQLLYLCSILAMIIGFLGLFGLVAYSLRTRLKEMAIRKIMGAGLANLMLLIIREYLVIMIAAAIIAIPVSYITLNKWFENFAYRVDISGGAYILTLVIILVLILIAAGFHIQRNYRVNPADILRQE